MNTKERRSPLALAILALLYEAPMHPYEMQRLIKARGKDKYINVRQRASIYQTIARLQRDGLLVARETTRDEKRPERTVYELTAKGEQTVQRWLRQALATPAQEFPEFPAAVSFLPLLTPEDVVEQLEVRERALVETLTRTENELQEEASRLPRLFLLEEEYVRTVVQAELTWVRSLIADLRSGQITWSGEWLRALIPPDQK
jgi:DNA-binding PadR family transcriptional regulator